MRLIWYNEDVAEMMEATGRTESDVDSAFEEAEKVLCARMAQDPGLFERILETAARDSGFERDEAAYAWMEYIAMSILMDGEGESNAVQH